MSKHVLLFNRYFREFETGQFIGPRFRLRWNDDFQIFSIKTNNIFSYEYKTLAHKYGWKPFKISTMKLISRVWILLRNYWENKLRYRSMVSKIFPTL